MLMPALEKAAQEDVEFRQGLPLHYLRYMGSNVQSALETVRKLGYTIFNVLLYKMFSSSLLMLLKPRSFCLFSRVLKLNRSVLVLRITRVPCLFG